MQLAAYPSTLSQPLTEALLLAGIAVKLLDEADTSDLDTSDWSAILVELGDDPMRNLREVNRLLVETGLPVLVVAEREHLPMVDSERDVTDFILHPIDAVELRVRLGRLVADSGDTEILEYRDLSLNTATYQATVLHSLAAADFDRDGDVDLFCCGRNPAREQGQSEGILGTPIPYHDANNGGPNLLLRNDGDLQFTDVTVLSGARRKQSSL